MSFQKIAIRCHQKRVFQASGTRLLFGGTIGESENKNASCLETIHNKKLKRSLHMHRMPVFSAMTYLPTVSLFYFSILFFVAISFYNFYH